MRLVAGLIKLLQPFFLNNFYPSTNIIISCLWLSWVEVGGGKAQSFFCTVKDLLSANICRSTKRSHTMSDFASLGLSCSDRQLYFHLVLVTFRIYIKHIQWIVVSE